MKEVCTKERRLDVIRLTSGAKNCSQDVYAMMFKESQ